MSHFTVAGLAFPLCAALACAAPASATPILGPELESFTVLGASTVTNIPTSAIIGNVGVSPGVSITGFNSSPGVAVADPQVTSGLVHATTADAALAQSQLTTARDNLDSLGPGITLVNPDLTGLTLLPGVYTVKAGTTNLSGTLTLDGGGDANAAWVFQMESSLITSTNSVVNVIGTGSGAGLFWNVRSSATIEVGTTFLGNILALTSITMNTNATDICGRALADTAAVTLDQNTLGGTCTGILAGSKGLSGGLDVTGPEGVGGVVFLPFVSVPEPGTLALLGFGLAGLGFARRRKSAA